MPSELSNSSSSLFIIIKIIEVFARTKEAHEIERLMGVYRNTCLLYSGEKVFPCDIVQDT
ncbi:hypothetical protein HPP92_017017 [Vanilla planifolia]|uniref:Uncharacterized protein n=1 Tax=Vanilla planifolia TaxID=51239 RepID=A0A835QKA3_VANPL|nr:hypothetical protein HPP92_017017 [Vanilla planifolia]